MENPERNNFFISYHRAVVEFTKQANDVAKKAKLTVWIDWDDMSPG